MKREGLPETTARAASSRYSFGVLIPRSLLALWLALVLASGASGCVVRVYQPMSGLHQPAVVDPQALNLQDIRLDVHCIPGELINPQMASMLCQRVGALFENQGAEVRTVASAGPVDDGFEGGPAEEAAGEDAAPRTDLSLELRSRLVHESVHPLSWVIGIGSFTLLPSVRESTFAQDVVIRDGSGFLLASDSLQGRLVVRFGFGPWAGNALLDLVRPKDERLGGRAADHDLSADLYQQLSQLMFNAKMQWLVLQESAPPARAHEVP